MSEGESLDQTIGDVLLSSDVQYVLTSAVTHTKHCTNQGQLTVITARDLVFLALVSFELYVA